MKIEREGKVFELTTEERYSAYYEQEHEFDIEDVIGELESRCDGEDDTLVRELLADRDRLSAAADKKRRLVDDFDVNWNDATREAVDEAITRLAEAKGDKSNEWNQTWGHLVHRKRLQHGGQRAAPRTPRNRGVQRPEQRAQLDVGGGLSHHPAETRFTDARHHPQHKPREHRAL